MNNSNPAPDLQRLQRPSDLASLLSRVFEFLRGLLRRPPPKKSRLIEHVIVLMFENRSFDHMLGYLPHAGALTGDESNPLDPLDPNSEHVRVTNQAGYITPIDPAHDFVSVAGQLFGHQDQVVDPAPMSGFVKACIEQAQGDVAIGKQIMDCFDPDKLPALRTLAEEFCLCTQWFSSVPGPTWPNRFFVHAATSDGMITNDARHIYDMKTIYDSLADEGLSWNIYHGDFPHSLALQRLWDNPRRFRALDQFHTDVENGHLAHYTFIEPRYFDFLAWKANDQHPPHDVRLGEYLIAEVYETLRSSRFWEKSLLIVLYDEHGGFFDRVSPPRSAPNPDGQNSQDPPFDFTRLGIRVPAILVSPLIEKGQVDATPYEHSSVPASIKALFDLPGHLTARDKAANTFEKNLSRSTPRTDTPLTLPVPGTPAEIQHHRQLMRTSSLQADVVGAAGQSEASQEPLSEFQETLVALADRLNSEVHPQVQARAAQVRTEHEGAVHTQESLARFKER
jgi:phospholipase C